MFKFPKFPYALSVFAVAGLILVAAGVAAQDHKRDHEPIAFIGHGVMFDQGGGQIQPTVAFIGKAQVWYRRDLVEKLDKERRARFVAMERGLAKDLKLDAQSRLVMNAYLLDWLIQSAGTKDATRLLGKNRLMKLYLQAALPGEAGGQFRQGLRPFKVHPELLKRLTDWSKGEGNLPGGVAKLVTGVGGQAYRDLCAANGVPIPPDIGTAGWVSQGLIPQSELFIVRSLQAEVMTYKSTSPAGMCIALPRFGVDQFGTPDIVQLDGVICMGEQPSADTLTPMVCFWDNEKNTTTVEPFVPPFEFPRFTGGVRTVVPFANFGGGSELAAGVGGVCSDCHSGENPYIIHGTTLSNLPAAGLTTFPVSWPKPIVRTGDVVPWPENPGPMNSPQSCRGCHGMAGDPPGAPGRLPHLSTDLPGYCGAVLRSSIGALAPPMPGRLNPPPTMPMNANVGKLACTSGLPSGDPRYRACSAATTVSCTPTFNPADPRVSQPDFPAAYQVMCTPEMASLLAQCGLSPANDGSNRGDPHITTVNSINYDFQGAGEFVALRHGDGMEIQTRQTPISTAGAVTNTHTGLTSCVSLNTAVAARVGNVRVSYQPKPGGEPDPAGLQLRIDGQLKALNAPGINLPGGGRIVRAGTGNGIEILFPNKTHLIATANWWASQGLWYLNVDVVNTPAREGVMGAILSGGWLPALSNGSPTGPLPATLHQRHVYLNQTFANSWRVTDPTSLFDYLPGGSTNAFTNTAWPPENPPCVVPKSKTPPIKPIDGRKAREICAQVTDKTMNAQCIADVTVTGEPGFARAYLTSQQLRARARAAGAPHAAMAPVHWGAKEPPRRSPSAALPGTAGFWGRPAQPSPG